MTFISRIQNNVYSSRTPSINSILLIPRKEDTVSIRFGANEHEYTQAEFDGLFKDFDGFITKNQSLIHRSLNKSFPNYDKEVKQVQSLEDLFSFAVNVFNTESNSDLKKSPVDTIERKSITMSESQAEQWVDSSEIKFTLYHARNKSSRERILKNGFGTYRTKQGYLGYGTYFTEFPSTAHQWFSHYRQGEGVIYKAKANINKHLQLNNRSHETYQKLITNLYEGAFKAYLSESKPSHVPSKDEALMALKTRLFHNYLGYDAVSYNDEYTGIVIFDPNRIAIIEE